MVEEAGFHNVQVHDQKDSFLAVLHQELDSFREQKERVVKVGSRYYESEVRFR